MRNRTESLYLSDIEDDLLLYKSGDPNGIIPAKAGLHESGLRPEGLRSRAGWSNSPRRNSNWLRRRSATLTGLIPNDGLHPCGAALRAVCLAALGSN